MTLWRKITETLGVSTTKPSGKPNKSDEKRIAIRRRQRLAEAYIWSPSMTFSKPCRIRDVSMTGARIEMCDDKVKRQAKGDPLILYFPEEKREIDCKVAWQSGRNIGIEFSGTYRAPTRQYHG